mgnify:FL=1
MKEYVSLAPLTTLGVGGKARFFVGAQSVEEVMEALAFARANSLPVFVLGGGSNIVIADSGFDGLVIAMRVSGITTEKHGNRLLVTVGAGVAWDDFIAWSIENKLHGLECMSGVPGTVGGAVVANLGAYGVQCSDTFVHAEVIDTLRPFGRSDAEDESCTLQVIRKEQCNFSYHDSMFSHSKGRYVLVRATFALSTDSSAHPSYRDNRFDMETLTKKLGRTPTQKEVRDSVLTMREEKGSLIMKDRLSFKSAGSFFHMPFVSAEKYAEVVRRAQELDVEKEESLRPWAWAQPDGSYKIAPGFLLEYTEFQKGYVRAFVGISPRHTLSIINVAGASAKDIAKLANDMQSEVEKIFLVRLEREVEYVGDVY